MKNKVYSLVRIKIETYRIEKPKKIYNIKNMKQKKHGENFFPLPKSSLSTDYLALSQTNTNTKKTARSKLELNNHKTRKNKFSQFSTTSLQAAPKQEVVSITYEEIGLFPRSFSRVLDRFLKQVFSDVENLVIQEYRFYRYLFLTTLKCLLILFFVPFLVNFLAKSYVVRPLTEYFWNTKQTEIFLNSYQQKHAFAELKDFEEKLYFESLIYPKSVNQPEIEEFAHDKISSEFSRHNKSSSLQYTPIKNNLSPPLKDNQIIDSAGLQTVRSQARSEETSRDVYAPMTKNWVGSTSDFVNFYKFPKNIEFKNHGINSLEFSPPIILENKTIDNDIFFTLRQRNIFSMDHSLRPVSSILKKEKSEYLLNEKNLSQPSTPLNVKASQSDTASLNFTTKDKRFYVHPVLGYTDSTIDDKNNLQKGSLVHSNDFKSGGINSKEFIPERSYARTNNKTNELSAETSSMDSTHKTNAPTSKSSFLVYQTIEADKNIQQRYQEKTIELAQRYNDQSVEAITNFFGDVVSLVTLFYLLYVLEIQINITQSFLLEVFFGLDDSKKSLLILLVTDLLVGYHSSNLWELFFELFFNHYGLPESQTGIFLLVATLPVLLDVLFKYLIFRHLNRSSPATVATYHAIIE
mgnify:FL=1